MTTIPAAAMFMCLIDPGYQKRPKLSALLIMDTTVGDTTQTVGGVDAEPAEWVEGFPVPKGARRRDALGAATTLASGRNYTLRVYEVEADVGAIIAFYKRYLPDAKRTSAGRKVKFSKPGASITVERSARGTRITLIVGPHSPMRFPAAHTVYFIP